MAAEWAAVSAVAEELQPDAETTAAVIAVSGEEVAVSPADTALVVVQQTSAKAASAIHWTPKRTKTLLEMLTCPDETPFDKREGARWPTFGDLRRRPPPNGDKGHFYAIYEHWKQLDPSIAIDPSHPVMQSVDISTAVGQLFATRLSQTMKKKYELATEWVTGNPQPPKSIAAEAELRSWGVLELCQEYFKGNKGRKRKAAAVGGSDGSPMELGGLSGRITPGSHTHRGLPKPPLLTGNGNITHR